MASNLPGVVEGMDMRPDGLLALGVHGAAGTSTLYAYNPFTKAVVPAENIPGLPYYDIEGIAVCNPQ